MEPERSCAEPPRALVLRIGRLSLHTDREPPVLPAVVLVMSRVNNVLAVVSIGLATISSARAQPTDSKACSEQERSNQTLSEKLGQNSWGNLPA